jgi:hypothetical protein
MYTALRELNDNTEYANAAKAWQNFVTLRADQCKTIRAYIGNFREAVIDLNTAGISFKWVKPKAPAASNEAGVSELIFIHSLRASTPSLQNGLKPATTIFVAIAHGRSSRPSRIAYVTRTAS